MQRLGIKAIIFGAGLAMSSAAPVLAADGGTTSAPAHVEMTDDGPVLVTPSGVSLYMYSADDTTPGKSACTNVPVKEINDPTSGFGKYPLPGREFLKSCAEKWPPFSADANAKAGGDWSVIDRPEGGKQWVYSGHPLYTSLKDHKPGDRNGVVAGADFGRRGWRLAMGPLNFPPGLQFTRDADTLVLATANGRPVYTPRNKHAPACAGCDEVFQPIGAPAVVNVSGDWSVVDAGAGRLQYAYKGKPLFAAPDSLSNGEIVETGGWETVVFRKIASAPSEIGTHFSILGDVYTDKAGETLYIFTCPGMGTPGCDDPGSPAAFWSALCGDGKECARRWRPYLASVNAKASGDWSVVDVSYPMFTNPSGVTYPPETPRVKAWAYRGRPVYTYYEDKAPGDVWGNQLRWFGMSAFAAVQVPGHGALD